jgi:hypothetical protein
MDLGTRRAGGPVGTAWGKMTDRQLNLGREVTLYRVNPGEMLGFGAWESLSPAEHLALCKSQRGFENHWDCRLLMSPCEFLPILLEKG